jgi:hypothetical protein
MLDMVISSEAHAALPDPVRAEYTERDGQFQLQVDGAFSRIDRDTLQRSLEAERGDHKTAKQRLAAFGDATPEGMHTVWDKLVEARTQIDAGTGSEDVETAANRISESRVAAAVRPLERQVGTLTGERDTAVQERDTLRSTINTSKVTDAVIKAFGAKGIGGINDAKPDVVLFSQRTFELNEAGEVVSRDVDGVTPGLPPKEIFTDMVSKGERRHWFAPTTGAGARPGSGGDLANNIFKVDPKTGKAPNLTACMQLIKNDVAAAKRMIAQAGVQASYPTLFAGQ